MRLMIIWGSSRHGRRGGAVSSWVHRNADNDPRFEVDFVDLQELTLPFFDEPTSPLSMKSLDNYTHPEGRAWAERVQMADAFIIVTPEYNFGYTGVLKNALDWVGQPWIDKPVGFVGYGSISGGIRAVDQLRQVVVELGLVQVANAIHFPRFRDGFDEKGEPKYPGANDNLKKMFDEIIRLAGLFKKP
jgi:NAD(P)H-dependent FMN reductase